MITPAVPISACGALIFSTAARLARGLRSVELEMAFVDRLREMYRARPAGGGRTAAGEGEDRR
jgi:hypothetical protein